jgi:hypothetical protein
MCTYGKVYLWNVYPPCNYGYITVLLLMGMIPVLVFMVTIPVYTVCGINTATWGIWCTHTCKYGYVAVPLFTLMIPVYGFMGINHCNTGYFGVRATWNTCLLAIPTRIHAFMSIDIHVHYLRISTTLITIGIYVYMIFHGCPPITTFTIIVPQYLVKRKSTSAWTCIAQVPSRHRYQIICIKTWER